MKARAFFPLVLAMAALVRPTAGIIIIGAEEPTCQAPPPDGSPWNYVARMDNPAGPHCSGVYLGNRYVVTCNHVGHDLNAAWLKDKSFPTDESFAPVAIAGTDLRVLRLAGDPGLPPIPLIDAAESEMGKPCTMIGWGVGKGRAIPNKGWHWGDGATRHKRWATNITDLAYHIDPDRHFVFLPTVFDVARGPRTGQLAVGDSGCGLFMKFGDVWKLVGIGADVEIYTRGLYDKNPRQPGPHPDHSYFVPVRAFLGELKRLVEGPGAAEVPRGK